jgi:hypothetical protein
MTMPDQQRRLLTEIPGPKSKKLQERRGAQLANGLGVTMPAAASSSMSMAITSSTSPPESRSRALVPRTKLLRDVLRSRPNGSRTRASSSRSTKASWMWRRRSTS